MYNDHMMPPSEPEFAGVGRRLLVDGLLAVFDQVSSSRIPRWISLEAPLGWGKARLVREFHSRLAAEQTPISAPSFTWWSVPASARDLSPEEIASRLTQLSGADVPVVIFLEDLQLVGDLVAEALSTCVMSNSAILIITTSLPELLNKNEHVRLALGTAHERITRITPTLNALPFPFPAGSSLAQIDRAAAAELVRFYYPLATSDTLTSLTAHYGTPLALKLFCSIEKYRLRFPEGALNLGAWEIENLPQKIEDLYRVAWDELPTATRLALTVVSVGLPLSTGSDHTTSVLGWRFPLLLDALGAYHRTDADDVAAALANSVDSPVWAQRLSEVFRDFQECLPWPRVLEESPNTNEGLRTSLLDALASIVEESLDSEEGNSTEIEGEQELLYRAQLALSLNNMQKLDPDSLSHAVHSALFAMQNSPHLLRSRVKLGNNTLAALEAGSWPWCLVAQIHGSALLEDGQNKTAITLFEEALWAVTTSLGPDDPAVLRTRHRLASALEEDGQVHEAIVLYENIVAVQQRSQGPLHFDTLVSLHNLAYAYSNAGRANEAITMFQDLIVTQLQLLGPDDPSTLTTCHNLAEAYENVGQVDQAIVLFQRVVADLQRVLGPDHRDTLQTQDNLAGAYETDGRVDDALGLYEEVIEIRQRVLGNDHPDTLLSRNNLAYTLMNAGMADRSIPIYQDVVERRQRTLGPDHPDSLEARHNLASAFEADDQIDLAIQIYRGVDEDFQRVLGPDHPGTWVTRSNLANAYMDAGRIDDAISLYTYLVADQTRALGSDHPETLASHQDLAAAYYHANQLPESCIEFEKVLCSIRRSEGDQHIYLFEVLENLGLIYDQLGRLDDRARINADLSALDESD